MNRLFDDVIDTIHATLYGTLAVAVVQGTMGGLMFWWLGLPVPLLWGIVMGLLAVVPVLGALSHLDSRGHLSGFGRQRRESPAAYLLGRDRGRRNRQLTVSIVGWKAVENAHRPRVHFYRWWADCFRSIRPNLGSRDIHSHQIISGNLEQSDRGH